MATPQKCAHKGCGKTFTDPEEPCVYHPGPPEFHEGQKGWKCCKPRVLTFDEFLEIPPCTTGKHSITDENAEAQAKADRERKERAATEEANAPKRVPIASQTTPANGTPALSSAIPAPPSKPASPAPELEEDSDDPEAPVPESGTCKRRSCGRSVKDSTNPRQEECIYHPGVPIFHEGSKGWTCCKRRVLEFDEFMKITGCKTRTGHCFVGKRSKKGADGSQGNNGTDAGNEEVVAEVRNDFYQTASTVIVSFYLKKIDKSRAKVEFRSDGSGIDLDLPTADGKRYTNGVDTWKELDPEKSTFRILGTKLEMTLVKRDAGLGWPVLRQGEKDYGERIQVGRAGRA